VLVWWSRVIHVALRSVSLKAQAWYVFLLVAAGPSVVPGVKLTQSLTRSIWLWALSAHFVSTAIQLPHPSKMSVSWQSVRWPDGSSYEGLVNDADECHVRGVFRYPGGDRYEGAPRRAPLPSPSGRPNLPERKLPVCFAALREGEYVDGAMHGFGVYVWSDGT
jgi:hypothetical protein